MKCAEFGGLREDLRFCRNEVCEKLGLIYDVISANSGTKATTSYDFEKE